MLPTVLPALILTAVLTPQQDPVATPPRPPDTASVVSLEGCLSGDLLTTRPAPGGATSASAPSGIYKVKGKKNLRSEIKKASGALVRVTGRLTGMPAPDPSTKVGKVTVYFGTGTLSDAHPEPPEPEPPTVDVTSLKVLETSCGG
jgi:hypothetical protein